MSNVLIYSGPGVSTSCSQHTLKTLQQLLPTYDVQFINSNSIATDPWQHFTSLFVLPGGRDLPFIDELEKKVQLPITRNSSSSSITASTTTTTAADQIKQYVSKGGKFIGICAGAYYASAACEFEKGVEGLQVVGQRNALRFFQGTCKGTVYPGFNYDNEVGSRIVKLVQSNQSGSIEKKKNSQGALADKDKDESQLIWWSHYNGGGAFLDVEKDTNAEILANYPEDDEELKSNDEKFDYSGKPAIISCKVENGKAILFGTHPEFPLDFRSRPIQLLRDGKSSLPFFQEEKKAKVEEGEKDLGDLNQDQKLELGLLEIERLRKFGEILRDQLGLIVSIPNPKENSIGKELSSSTSSQTAATSSSSQSQEEDEVKLTPLYLVSQDQMKVDQILNELKQVQANKGKAKEDIPHLKELSSSSSSKHQDLDKINSSHLLSFQDVNDTFHFYSSSDPSSSDQTRSKNLETDSILSNLCKTADYSIFKTPLPRDQTGKPEDQETASVVDLQKIPKYIITYSSSSPDSRLPNPILTPHFNLDDYFRYLNESRERLKGIDFSFKVQNDWFGGMKGLDLNRDDQEGEAVRIGDPLIYSQVVTSTQTMLDKNYKFLTRLPSGLTILATHQATGRGRGSNNWISPLGCLQFSILLRLSLNKSSNVVFVQYLAGLSIIQSIKSGLGEEYKSIGEKIRIKWPNDIYAVVEDEQESIAGGEERKGTLRIGNQTFAKLSGVLVNSSFSKNEFSLVVGCGINCLNERPTTSLSDLIKSHNFKNGKSQDQGLEIVSQERLAGSVLATFEKFWKVFQEFGFEPFVEMYREIWLHSDQIVTLEDSIPPTPVKIVGIATDHGTLRAVPLSSSINSSSEGAWGKAGSAAASSSGWSRYQSHGQDEFIDLQPDGNSFDMLKNLIRSKK